MVGGLHKGGESLMFMINVSNLYAIYSVDLLFWQFFFTVDSPV